MRRRLDVELVRRKLAPSRHRAAEAVAAGHVRVGGMPATSPARQVAPDEPITVRPPEHDPSEHDPSAHDPSAHDPSAHDPSAHDPSGADYVSRGGRKLAAALDAFAIPVEGRRAVDVGASTGGFTDVLLRRGARDVVAIDVGYGQLAWRLRNDPRVTVLERTNVRNLGAGAVGEPAELLVADLSFISLRTVAANLLALAAPDADLVLLVKPQFEAGRARVGKGGVVRDPAVRAEVLREVLEALTAAGVDVRATVVSPIHGARGNVEHFVHGRPRPEPASRPWR